jgi:hypothetical protein
MLNIGSYKFYSDSWNSDVFPLFTNRIHTKIMYFKTVMLARTGPTRTRTKPSRTRTRIRPSRTRTRTRLISKDKDKDLPDLQGQ